MQHLILLHGAAGAKGQLKPIADALAGSFTTHLLNFSGHGGEGLPAAGFNIAVFMEDVLVYMRANGIDNANIFGYSMGGYVAMCLAAQHPGKVNRVITLATKFFWDEAVAAKEIKMLDAGTIQQKVPAFAEALRRRHLPNNWIDVLEETKGLLQQLGKENFLQPERCAAINNPCLLLLGDRDKMVSLDETVAVCRQLRHGQLGVLPDTPHPVEQVSTNTLAFFIRQFLSSAS